VAFAAPYLANAWALADGDMDRAVRLYASGFITPQSQGMRGLMRNADSPPATPAQAGRPHSPPAAASASAAAKYSGHLFRGSGQ